MTGRNGATEHSRARRYPACAHSAPYASHHRNPAPPHGCAYQAEAGDHEGPGGGFGDGWAAAAAAGVEAEVVVSDAGCVGGVHDQTDDAGVGAEIVGVIGLEDIVVAPGDLEEVAIVEGDRDVERAESVVADGLEDEVRDGGCEGDREHAAAAAVQVGDKVPSDVGPVDEEAVRRGEGDIRIDERAVDECEVRLLFEIDHDGGGGAGGEADGHCRGGEGACAHGSSPAVVNVAPGTRPLA